MKIPSSTYRIQLNSTFRFEDVEELLPYFTDLGVSDLYASPILKARKGSAHGYDVADHRLVSRELGGLAGWEALAEQLGRHRIGWIQDIVPNHMVFHHDNPILIDVLENGPASKYAELFDVDWQHPSPRLKGKILAPFLGEYYGDALEAGKLRLRYGPEGLQVVYYDLSFPLCLDSYPRFFESGLSVLKARIGDHHRDFVKLLGVLYVIKSLSAESPEKERYEQIKFVKAAIWEMYRQNRDVRAYMEAALDGFNGRPGDPSSFDALDGLLGQQFFKLAYWKVSTEEINYRRFFNINDLISVRVERESVFRHVHGLLFRLHKRGGISGFRVDHVDGLYDPESYLRRLRQAVPGAYLVVEKILQPSEGLCESWPVEGTTGYDFLGLSNALFCRSEGLSAMTRIYASLTGAKTDFRDIAREKRRLIIDARMAGDIDNLVRMVREIAGLDRRASDITLAGLSRALRELLSVFPVYRTYIGENRFTEGDRKIIRGAVAEAVERNPSLVHELSFLRRFLLMEVPDYLPEEERRQWLRFATRFQQFTAPLMAKGFEDTALYVFNRLISLNDVGSRPDEFGLTADDFHARMAERSRRWPHTMNATSSHDTKRGEDVRARINVLSEIPMLWEGQVRKWMRTNVKEKRRVRGHRVPEANDEYFLYQTLLGAWPFSEEERPDFLGRIKEYVVKAVREAKVHTAWIKPDEEYESAYVDFVERILRPKSPFLADFLPFARQVAHFGVLNSLSQTLLRFASPGVPDIYQGAESWDLRLVDPDNRRPVNYKRRRQMLNDIRQGSRENAVTMIRKMSRAPKDGRIKLFLIHKLLLARREHRELFLDGDYVPLKAERGSAANVISFARRIDGAWALAVVPRFFASLVSQGQWPLGAGIWQDTCIRLPGGFPARWGNVITGERIEAAGALRAADALKHFPCALLVSRG